MREGWVTSGLGDLCEILDSQRKPITKRNRVAGDIPYYGATGIKDHVADYLFDEQLVLVGEDGAKWGAGENTAFAVEGKCWVNNHAHVLRPKREKILDNWIIYFLISSDLSEFVSGLTVPKLNQGNLRSIPIPVPPLPEQRRIVAILDEAFEGIAAAKANAEKNLENAREVFENWFDELIKSNENRWLKKQLNDVCEVIRGSSPRPIKKFLTNASNGVNWVKIRDATRSGKYISETAEKITPKGAERSREVGPGDLLLTNSMSYGLAFIMATKGYVHDGWFVLRNYAENFELEFFYELLVSKHVQQQFGGLAAGSVVKNISSDLVKKAVLPIPDKKEQVSLQKNIAEIKESVAKCQSNFKRKIDILDELKKSLLHQAFNGDL